MMFIIAIEISTFVYFFSSIDRIFAVFIIFFFWSKIINYISTISFIFLVLVIIGGSLVSTSSGLRFFKIFLLTKFSFNELVSHAKPKQILLNKTLFSKAKIDLNDINKYFFTIIIFVLSLTALTSLLTLFNFEFESAFKLAILTLMNTVNSSLHGLDYLNFSEFSFFLKIILSIFMIIGRIEFITILILIKKFVFKN